MIQSIFLIINLAALILFGFDKARAKAQQRRIPERILLGIGFLGGAWGALLGMKLFRHKTRKPIFWITMIPTALFYIWLFVYLA